MAAVARARPEPWTRRAFDEASQRDGARTGNVNFKPRLNRIAQEGKRVGEGRGAGVLLNWAKCCFWRERFHPFFLNS